MSGDCAEYAICFPVGERVRIGIPLTDGGELQQWGVVCSLERDLLELELAGAYPRQDARFPLGRTLEMRLLGKGATTARPFATGS